MNIQDILKPENQILIHKMNSAMKPITEAVNAAILADPDAKAHYDKVIAMATEELKKHLPEGSYDFPRLFIFPLDLDFIWPDDPCA